MIKKDLEIFDFLRFQDKIKINGKVLFRSNSPHDINLKEKYWEYEFYDKWDKKKNLLPKTSHLVKLYSTFKKKNKNGRQVIETKEYKRATLLDLNNKKEEEILTIEHE
jgi:hypothetical protein